MTVYLVDEPFYDIALSYALNGDRSSIVLLEDAVYLALRENQIQVETFAIADDVSRRGLNSKMPSSVHIITYDNLVEMMEREKVVNFL